jgi:hypothetical protein
LKRLSLAAAAMTLATLARYEAWPVAALSVLVVVAASSAPLVGAIKNGVLFSTISALGPLYWLCHNWAIYGNAAEFLTGPNSARGIFLQNLAHSGQWSKILLGNVGWDVLTLGGAVSVCAGPLVLLLGAGGAIRWLIAKRKSVVENAPAFLLLVPFLFHIFSLYRGEIQMFPLSAFGLHNVRYGLPHILPAALFAPAAVLMFKGSARRFATAAVSLMVVAQYGYLISDGPSQLAVYQEGYRNGVNARPVRERLRVASFLKANPPDRLILMHTGALGPVVSQGGLRFADTIHEGCVRWHQLDDGIPDDVATVLIQDGDPLDLRLQQSSTLSRDLAEEFQEKFSAGNIKLFARQRP